MSTGLFVAESRLPLKLIIIVRLAQVKNKEIYFNNSTASFTLSLLALSTIKIPFSVATTIILSVPTVTMGTFNSFKIVVLLLSYLICKDSLS